MERNIIYSWSRPNVQTLKCLIPQAFRTGIKYCSIQTLYLDRSVYFFKKNKVLITRLYLDSSSKSHPFPFPVCIWEGKGTRHLSYWTPSKKESVTLCFTSDASYLKSVQRMWNLGKLLPSFIFSRHVLNNRRQNVLRFADIIMYLIQNR